ncbi:putative protein disulfide isomerase [Histomonas meleagridis]|uniref:putative protein disulfide isomerase n=1 Tax=Histomonas meleagridis TaxID=135588 RepID=UPI003559EA39|nr:putative protein disulfide isomerase [Histomonas meleagridis]KAH0799388.1 putative protein disulfide isomerase [Histomonas meleagridis]
MIFVAFVSIIKAFSHPYSVEINKENVFDIIGKEKHVFVHFFSEGCKFCLKAQPEWNELVRIYYPIKDIVFATINCDRWRSLCSAFDGTSTPNFQYFAPHQRSGSAFGGEAEVVSFARWVKQMTSILPYTKPHTLMFTNPKEINDLKEEGYVFTVLDDPKTQFYNHSVFRKVENQFDIPFRSLSPKEYPEESKAFCDSPHCVVLLYKNEKYTYNGEIEIQNVMDFIDSHIPEDSL